MCTIIVVYCHMVFGVPLILSIAWYCYEKGDLPINQQVVG